jgi:hypothetical protein
MGESATDRPKCSANSKRTGNPCGQYAMAGRTVCRSHGGLTPSLHRLKNGMQSKLPSRLAESYQRGLADGSILDQRRSIALMEAVAEDLAERIKTGDTPEIRRAASLMARDAQTLLESGDVKEARAKVKRLVLLLEQGVEGDAGRDKLFSMADRIGTRRDAAWTTKLQRIQVMNAQDVATMLGLVLLRSRAKWGDEQARQLAEMFEALLSDRPAVPGRGDLALAAITVEGQTVNGGTNGNTAAGS